METKLFTITEGLENMGAIKTGEQGSVFKARRGETITAVKLLPTPIALQSEENKEYRDFISEVNKLKKLNENPSPNVVKITGHGFTETGSFPYIEMEYIAGPDLCELLKPPHAPVFAMKEIIKVAEHLSNALAHCHKLGVKHGDIQACNIRFNQATGNYVLVDFGLGMLSQQERREVMQRNGAIEFMAPEQHEGEIYFETDVYSVGVVLYELFTGSVPFPLKDNTEASRNEVVIAHSETRPSDMLQLRAAALPAGLPDEEKALEMQPPAWLGSFVYKCLEKKSFRRFGNGMELQYDITHRPSYSDEIAEVIKNEDAKWQTIIEKKNKELEELRAAVIEKNKKEPAQKKTVVTAVPVPIAMRQRKAVSPLVRIGLFIALFILAGIAAYSLFFNKSAVGAAQSNELSYAADSSSSASAKKTVAVKSPENKPAEKNTAVNQEPVKKQIVQSTPQIITTTVYEKPVQEKKRPQPLNPPREIYKEEMEIGGIDKDKGEEKIDDSGQEGVRYKVRSKAYFHNDADPDTRRDAFIIHWNKAVLTPLDEKNGFIYVVFTNHLGQTSRGWLSKEDLLVAK